MKISVIIALLATSLSFADCIPWVGGAKTYVAGDCVTLDGVTYIANRDVNEWTHPYDTWHWTAQGVSSSSSSTSSSSTAISGTAILDRLAVEKAHNYNATQCDTRFEFPMTSQEYTVSKDGLVNITLQGLVVSYGENDGHLELSAARGTTSIVQKGYYLTEPPVQGGHYRPTSTSLAFEAVAGETFTISTKMVNVMLDRNGTSCYHAISVLETLDVSFTEGGKMATTATTLRRQ